jgi:FtsH-binding integral membrane protein
MTSADFGRYAACGIAGFQILANVALLFRGFTRLPAEIAKEGATARIADLLRTSWVYGMLGNLCLGILLLLIASAIGRGESLARQLAAAIGVYYVVVGVAAYGFSPNRHAGFLVFALFGIILLAALWLAA